MPAILTVDDSRAVRTIVGKQVKELGFEVVEAEDGIQGLAKLAEAQVDLVLLDVTMPNMDGPAMLEQMRQAGNQTPVIMLTSESKRSVVSGAMKLGISDYIMKPFKPEELRAKVLAVLQGDPGVNAIVGQTSPAASDEPGAREMGGRFVDVLVVDDMENVQRKLRSLLPPHVTLNGFTNAQSALGACRDRVYRVVLIDTDIPDVDSSVLAKQLKMLQPHAALVALTLRTSNDVAKEAAEAGFDGVLLKPFRAENIDDFLLLYFDSQDLMQVEDNVIRVAAYQGRSDRVERFYGRLGGLLPSTLEKIAAACYDELVLDLGAPPLDGDRLPKFVNAVALRSKDYGMSLSVVGQADVRKILQGFTETRELRVCATLEEARGGRSAGVSP